MLLGLLQALPLSKRARGFKGPVKARPHAFFFSCGWIKGGEMIYDSTGDFFASFLRDAAIGESKWKAKHPHLPTREFVTLNHKIYG